MHDEPRDRTRDAPQNAPHVPHGAAHALRALDRRVLAELRGWGADWRVAAAARALSWSGEHAALWLAAGLCAAAADRERRGAWLRAAALTAAAHLTSMGAKRLVRRPRPARAEPLVRTAGRHSFPSSHAASATAAAVAYGVLRRPSHASGARHAGRMAGAGVVPPLAAAMCVSRLVVGVHYPSDVAAGAALGALLARLGAPWMTRPLRPPAPPPSRPHTAPAPVAPRSRPKGRPHV